MYMSTEKKTKIVSKKKTVKKKFCCKSVKKGNEKCYLPTALVRYE